ncbi:MAG: hypothetical protein ACHQ9S_08480 [Candidatus Binatia bacterium]
MRNMTLSNGMEMTANAGETKIFDVDVQSGGLSFHCSIPGGHAIFIKLSS